MANEASQKDKASGLYANQVDVTENSKHNGIELLFNREPLSELQSKLRAVGFRPSKIKNMWYSENQATAKAFAVELKSIIASSNSGPDLHLTPSFESTQLNIEKKEFSFVIIRLKDDQLKNYIVFEPSKPKAEVIATSFAKQQFGDLFSAIAVKPRTQIREARILFNEGKIISLKDDTASAEKPSMSLTPTESEKQRYDFPIPGLHFPEEEEILEQFKEKGFPPLFSAQEAFDRNLPVIDLAFRSDAALQYFRERIEDPARTEIQQLKRDLQRLGRGETKKREELKGFITELENEIRFSEKLIEDESLIFQNDLLSIILDQGKQKGYFKPISADMIGFRDYVLTHTLDNRGIENYPNEPVQKVVNELLEEFVHPKPDKRKESLTNEHGIYTKETAGENLEQISIPIPKTAQYEASIDIAKRTDGRFLIGIDASKKFGDFSGNGYAPGLTDKSFSTRKEALTAGAKEHETRLKELLHTKDHILQNDEKKNKQLTIALNALHAFASQNDLPLESEQTITPQPPEAASTANRKKRGQHSLNDEIQALIDERDKNKEAFTEEEKNKLRLYGGSGGLINQGATGKGVLYEYYTPDTIIKKMWDMAYHFGYDGGDVLEPSVGIGSFLKYAPKIATLVGYEVNHYAARIAQILYPTAQIHEAAFETNFFAGNVHLKDDYTDKRYSLVIGNPPYGEFSGKYAGMGEKKWTGMLQYEHYFTFRGLDLLKSGGLLIFILPSNFLKADSYNEIAKKIAAKCTGLDRYYLGTDIFRTTDIETDIIALRKN